MTTDPLVLLTDADRATEELLRTAAALDPRIYPTVSPDGELITLANWK